MNRLNGIDKNYLWGRGFKVRLCGSEYLRLGMGLGELTFQLNAKIYIPLCMYTSSPYNTPGTSLFLCVLRGGCINVVRDEFAGCRSHCSRRGHYGSCSFLS